MHELALLTDVVTTVAAAAGGRVVERVGLRVGARSGAVPEALHGAWPIATEGTLLAGAALDVETVSAAIWCPTCAAEVEVDEFYALRCPRCDTPVGALAHGDELAIAYAELADPGSATDP